MSESYGDVIRRLAVPLEPEPTGVEPRVGALEGVRAVLFDVHGTLFLTATGEDPVPAETRAEAFVDALATAGIACPGKPAEALAALDASIDDAYSALRERGVDHPEVDIVAMWRVALQRLVKEGLVAELPEGVDFARLAVEFEGRANPVWPAPGLEACLDRLREAGVVLGLVSNAQFYTEEIFPAFLGRDLEALGFAEDLCCLSYRHARAKPGRHLFDEALNALRKRGVKPEQVLFVGNDMLNDVKPAIESGFRAALFAGDARSFAPRPKEKGVSKLVPVAVFTELAQIPESVAG